MSRIGFFGGCFNPPTLAHFEIVKNALNGFNLDKVIIVPMGDKYRKKDLISFEHRFNMLKKMFRYEEKVEISNIQEKQEKISYAIDSFKTIDKIYKNDERFFIMGLDNFAKINTWKDGDKLILNRKFIVFDRRNYNIENTYYDNVKFINVNNNTSSSLVRQMIKEKDNFEKLILPEVASYIKREGLYQ